MDYEKPSLTEWKAGMLKRFPEFVEIKTGEEESLGKIGDVYIRCTDENTRSTFGKRVEVYLDDHQRSEVEGMIYRGVLGKAIKVRKGVWEDVPGAKYGVFIEVSDRKRSASDCAILYLMVMDIYHEAKWQP